MDPWMVEILNYGVPQMMLAPAIIAALIAGGSSIFGSLFGGGEQHEPSVIPDPINDPLRTDMSRYYQGQVGKPRPAYEGQLTADYNPALIAALQNAMSLGQSGASAGSAYDSEIQGLLERFTSPKGAQGWNPGYAHWRNVPRGNTPPPKGGS